MARRSSGCHLPGKRVQSCPSCPLHKFVVSYTHGFVPLSCLRSLIGVVSCCGVGALRVRLGSGKRGGFFSGSFAGACSTFQLRSSVCPKLATCSNFCAGGRFVSLRGRTVTLKVRVVPRVSIPTRSLTFSHCGPRVNDGGCNVSRLSLFSPRACPFVSTLFGRCLRNSRPMFYNGQMRINASRCSGRAPRLIRGFQRFASRCVHLMRRCNGRTYM